MTCHSRKPSRTRAVPHSGFPTSFPGRGSRKKANSTGFGTSNYPVLLSTLLMITAVSCARFRGDRVLTSWDFASDTGGWTAAHQVTALDVSNGVLKTGATGRDPFIQTDPTRSLNLQVDERTGFVMKMKNTGRPTADLYGFVKDPADPDRLKVYRFHRFSTIPDGQWHTYRLYPFWNTELKSLRVDIPNSPTVEIDFIRIVRRPASGKQPHDATWQFHKGRAGWLLFRGEQELRRTRKGIEIGTPSMLVSDTVELVAADYGYATIEAASSGPVKAAMYWAWNHDSWLPGHFVKTFELKTGTNELCLDLDLVPAYDRIVKRIYLDFWSETGETVELRKVAWTDTPGKTPAKKPELRPASGALCSAAWPGDETKALPSAGVNGDRAWISTSRVGLVIPRSKGRFPGGRFFLLSDGKAHPMGILPHFGTVLGAKKEKKPIALRYDRASSGGLPDAPTLTLFGTTEFEGVELKSITTLKARSGDPWIDVSCSISSSRDIAVRAFRGPWLWAGESSFGATKDMAVYPGNEFLGPDEPSSNPRVASLPTFIRTVRHPRSITIPSACIEKDGTVVGLMWNPNQNRPADDGYPSFAFASPNTVEGHANHLLGLFAPAVPDGVPVNHLSADEPWIVAAEQDIKLTASVYAVADADATRCADLWIRRFGLPELPLKPRSYGKALKLSMRSYEDLLWSESHGRWAGWAGVLARNCDPSVSYIVASRTLTDTDFCTRLFTKGIRLANTSRLNASLFAGGDPAPPLSDELVQARIDAETVPEDGRIPFVPHRATDGRMGLGHPSESNSGICFNKALSLLRRARATGSTVALEAGERILKYAIDFRIPRGSQTWEVPMDCPDLFASTNGCEAYLIGYDLTGKADYLDKAVYWARTGLPFVYFWQAAGAPRFMKGASLAVYGTSMFRGKGWYARPVQWCGLAFARVLLQLHTVDQSLPWRHFAEMITISALYQQSTEPGNFGCYPDAWDLITGEKSSIMINPGRLVIPLLEFLDNPMEASHRSVRIARNRRPICISSGARVLQASSGASTLRCRLDSVADATVTTAIMPVSEPSTILLDGRPFPRLEDTGDASNGWWYTPGPGCVSARITFGDQAMDLSLTDLKAIAPEPPEPSWEFEHNRTDGWIANMKFLKRLGTEQGCLRLETLKPGAFIASPRLMMPVERFRTVKIRLRSTSPVLSFRFATVNSGFCAEQTLQIKIENDSEFHEISLPMDRIRTWKGTLRRFRIHIPEHPARVDIDWIRNLN